MQTRRVKFLDKLIAVLYTDACGNSWGRMNGLDYRFSLVCATVSSAVRVFCSEQQVIVSNEDGYQLIHRTDPIEIVTLPDYEMIGKTHNEALIRTLSTQPLENEQLNVNSDFIQCINIQVNECLAEHQLRNSGEYTVSNNNEELLSFDVQEELISFTQILAEQQSIKDVNQKAKEILSKDTDSLDLLE